MIPSYKYAYLKYTKEVARFFYKCIENCDHSFYTEVYLIEHNQGRQHGAALKLIRFHFW